VPLFCDGAIFYFFARVPYAAMARYFRPWPKFSSYILSGSDNPPVPVAIATTNRLKYQDFC
jgi:hypothetical protein